MKKPRRMTVTRSLYGNCEVYPPDSDRLMFRMDDERISWYVDKGLAVWVRKDPPAIRLTFEPGGPGHDGDPYFLQLFKNRCVVCGATENLTHHHIVPKAYKRHFPRESKGRWMYDVLLVCVRCHHRYEDFAHLLKEEIAVEFEVPSSGITNLSETNLRAMKAAAALYRHGDKIPPARKALLVADVQAYLGKDDFTPDDLWTIWNSIRDGIDVIPAGLVVARVLEGEGQLDDFAIRWRHHFLSKMKPKYLPDDWNPDRRIYSEPDQTAVS
jgi:hypothetical protein